MQGRVSDIRDVTAADRDAVCAMLASAFSADPAMSYIFPEARTRARRLVGLFKLLYDSDGANGMRLVTGEALAATLWRPPGRAEVGTFEMLRALPGMLMTFGGALGRAMRTGDALEAHYPSEPFWYLHVAGVAPEHQGKGLGSASIRAGLARVAGSGLPAYLETATESNVGLYQSLGFEVTGTWHVPKGGPKFWSMLRAPD